MVQIQPLMKGVLKMLEAESPVILTGLGVAGVISTSLLTVRATKDASRLIYQYDKEDAPLLDKIRVCWPCLVPPVVSGLTTIACIVGANHISAKRQAALLSAYTISELGLREYKEKVIETLGEKKDRGIQDLIAKDRLDKAGPPSEVIITNGGDSICYDSLSGRYFNSSIESIKKAQNDLNYRLLSDDWTALNEFYSFLGLPSIKLGEDVGWTSDKLLEVHFSALIGENEKPCIVINYFTEPKASFYRR